MDEYSSSTVSHQDAKESLYKNRLQEFTQRAKLPFPTYHSRSVRKSGYPITFRSTVVVDGKKYTSLGKFYTRKAAEQGAAAVALESLSETLDENRTCSKSILQEFAAKEKLAMPTYETVGLESMVNLDKDRTFSKSILHEFAAQVKLAMPTYETVRLESMFPLFASSLVFNGVKYTGEPGANKKEAEQFAARAAILSLLANTGAETPLSAIVKSKAKYISEHWKLTTSAVHLPNSGSDVGTYAMKELIAETTVNVTSEQQYARKRAGLSCSTSEFRLPNLEMVSGPNFPQPSLLPSSQTLLNPALMSNAQALPGPSLPKSESVSRLRGKKKKKKKNACILLKPRKSRKS